MFSSNQSSSNYDNDDDEFYINLFKLYDEDGTGELDKYQLHEMFTTIKTSHLTLQQIGASVDQVCGSSTCSQHQLENVLKEMDRRSAMMMEIEWEFKLLDENKDGTITVDNAKHLFEMVQGAMFDLSRWKWWLNNKRPIPSAPVFLTEIEVDLCDVRPPSDEKESLEKDNVGGSAARRGEKGARGEWSLDSEDDDDASEEASGLQDKTRKQQQKVGSAVSPPSSAIVAKSPAKNDQADGKNRKKKPLSGEKKTEGISEEAKNIIERAKDATRLMNVMKALDDACTKREIAPLEVAIANAKQHREESKQLEAKITHACKLLERLKRLEKLRNEVLDLKQSTIAELRSYNSPHPAVHRVMIATYLLLGTPEQDTKKWTKVQSLLGRSGKEGLKRRIGERKVTEVDASTARRSKRLLHDVDLEVIRDISAGAATFYVWVEGMVEEISAEDA